MGLPPKMMWALKPAGLRPPYFKAFLAFPPLNPGCNTGFLLANFSLDGPGLITVGTAADPPACLLITVADFYKNWSFSERL